MLAAEHLCDDRYLWERADTQERSLVPPTEGWKSEQMLGAEQFEVWYTALCRPGC
jgi:hypothetical protein